MIFLTLFLLYFLLTYLITRQSVARRNEGENLILFWEAGGDT